MRSSFNPLLFALAAALLPIPVPSPVLAGERPAHVVNVRDDGAFESLCRKVLVPGISENTWDFALSDDATLVMLFEKGELVASAVDLEKGEQTVFARLPCEHELTCMDFLAGSGALLAGGEDGFLCLFTVGDRIPEKLALEASFKAHEGPVRAVKAAGGILLSASDGRVAVWAIDPLAPDLLISRGIVPAHDEPVVSMVSSRDATLVLTVPEEGPAMAWKIAGETLLPLRAIGGQGSRITAAAVSDDGASAFVGTWMGKAMIYDLKPDAPGTASELLWPDAVKPETADFSRDGAFVVVASESGNVFVYETGTGNPEPIARISSRILLKKVRFSLDDRRLVTGIFGGEILTFPAFFRPVRVVIDDEEISWDQTSTLPESSRWPRLSAVHDWEMNAPGSEKPSRILRVTVFNRGAGPAHELTARLSVEPGGASPVMPAPIHFGTVAAGGSVTRAVALEGPGDEAEAVLRLDFSGAHDFAPPPITWRQLPRRTFDAGQYAALAKKVFQCAREIMRELIDGEFFDPLLEQMGSTGFGYTCSSGADGQSTVRFQNIYLLTEEGLDINRRVMQANTREEVLREAELMLYIYIPHELVHAARNHLDRSGGGWFEEYVANTVQPYLTEEVLKRLGDAPYTPESVRRHYERALSLLSERAAPGLVPKTDFFLESLGKAEDFGCDSWAMFNKDVPGYVYVGLRIALASLQEETKLEELRDRFLK